MQRKGVSTCEYPAIVHQSLIVGGSVFPQPVKGSKLTIPWILHADIVAFVISLYAQVVFTECLPCMYRQEMLTVKDY
jgi:hypothetical protein